MNILLTSKYVSGVYACRKPALTEPVPYFSMVPTLPLSETEFFSEREKFTVCSIFRSPILNTDFFVLDLYIQLNFESNYKYTQSQIISNVILAVI
jgi:hypothetical protein